MTHVVHVVRTLGHGGMEKNLRRVALATEPRGVRHSIILLSERKDLLQFPASIPVYRAYAAPRDPRILYQIGRHLRALEPSVIHARNWATWPDTAIARLAAAPRTPLVFSYHGTDQSEITRADRLKFQAMEKLTTRIFAVSHAARDLLDQSFGLDRARIGVIPNGVDTEKFAPPPAPRKHPKIIFGAVGRIFPIKNFPLLMRAFRLLLDRGVDAELRLAGDGPHEDRIRALRTELGLDEKMVMSGYVEDMTKFFHELDVFVLSSDNEANPNALLEAMATGLPAISTNVGGAAEVLDHGRCGVLVPRGDERAMSEAMLTLAHQTDLRYRLSVDARKHIVERYSQAAMFEAYERLYKDPRSATLD